MNTLRLFCPRDWRVVRCLAVVLCLTSHGTVDAQSPSPKPGEDEENEPGIITSESEASVSLATLVGGSAVWSLTAEQVEAEFKNKGFVWLDPALKNRAIIRPRQMMLKKEEVNGDSTFISFKPIKHQMELFGRAAHEATLEFPNGRLASLSISIWNKGDADQDMTETRFMGLVDASVQDMDKVLKVRGRNLGRDASGAVRVSRWRWDSAETLAQLEFSTSKNEDRSFQAEFLRLRLLPRASQGGSAVNPTAPAGRIGVLDLTKNVQKKESGDVFISSVPMVDQGQKGYCAVASTERVMRYYGLQVDQHDLASAAGTTATRGTNPREFEDAIHSMQGKLKFRVKDLISFDEREFEKLVQNYNREAKRLGGREWAEGNYYFEANPDILREARCRNGGYEKFRGYVVAATDRGLPLLWALHLGRYPETGRENPQLGGGHMRTIIGYNSKTDEVIFTDSWGPGHEFKKMKGRDACAATLGLYLIDYNGR